MSLVFKEKKALYFKGMCLLQAENEKGCREGVRPYVQYGADIRLWDLYYEDSSPASPTLCKKVYTNLQYERAFYFTPRSNHEEQDLMDLIAQGTWEKIGYDGEVAKESYAGGVTARAYCGTIELDGDGAPVRTLIVIHYASR